MNPLVIDTLTRPTLPSSSISYNAVWPDISKPKPAQINIASSLSSSLNKRKLSWQRDRSASLGSLKTIQQQLSTYSPSLASTSSISTASRRRGSTRTLSTSSASGSSSSELHPIQDNPEQSPVYASWWPFSIADPANLPTTNLTNGKGKQKATDFEPEPIDGEGEEDDHNDTRAPTRGFLEFFAGKGTVEHAKEARDAEREADEQEAQLLNASLRTLRLKNVEPISSTSIGGGQVSGTGGEETPKSALEGEPPPLPPKDSKQPQVKPTSFLPTSMFSSNPAPLEGPSSIFSSFSIPNPFAGSTTPTTTSTTPQPGTSPPTSTSLSQPRSSFSFSNPFSPSPSPSTSTSTSPPRPPPSQMIHHGRAYSSGPGTNLKDVTPMLDEEDSKRAKIEDDSHMDMFTLIKDRYKCTKYPLVFCHGLFGFDTLGPAGIKPLQFSYWIGVKEALEAVGIEVLIGRVPAAASIEERAKVLCELIEQTFPGREVNLIGHSMGGLDGRFLISRLKPTTFKVRSLTTIASPHRGSSFADFVVEDIIGSERVTALLGLMSSIGVKAGAFDDLTTTKMERFNVETPDDPEVKYYSYGAEFEPGWSNVFRISWGVIHEREGANDGLVSVESSQWGDYKATLTNVNHLDLIGWVGKVRFGWAEWLGKPIKFKPVSFFLAIAEMLADEGF